MVVEVKGVLEDANYLYFIVENAGENCSSLFLYYEFVQRPKRDIECTLEDLPASATLVVLSLMLILIVYCLLEFLESSCNPVHKFVKNFNRSIAIAVDLYLPI